MAFVAISTSAIDRLFEERANRLRGEAQSVDPTTGTSAPIRRPYRGIQIKDDTYATMSIVDGAGDPVPVISESYTGPNRPEGGKGRVNTYADFIIQSVSEERSEKNQIIETFGDSFIFFFGERPRMVNIQGVLINTEDFGWRSQFFYNYEHFLRGSKLVERNARLFLAYDTRVMEGYPISVSAQEDASNPYTVQFSMQIFLTNFQDFGRIGLIDFPGEPAPRDFDALNRDLEERALDFNTGERRPLGSPTFVSTTTAVRRGNFESRFDNNLSLGGLLREGIRGVNSITNQASGLIQDASALLSGRVVRKPLGIAGFISGLQGATIGAGVTQSLLDSFEFAGLSDTNLRIPGKPKFTPVREELLRGAINLNVDEYPLIMDTAANPRALSFAEEIAKTERALIREVAEFEQAAQLVIEANLAQAEAAVAEGIADTAAFIKTGFALYNTANAILSDPVGVSLDALGLSGAVDLVT